MISALQNFLQIIFGWIFSIAEISVRYYSFSSSLLFLFTPPFLFFFFLEFHILGILCIEKKKKNNSLLPKPPDGLSDSAVNGVSDIFQARMLITEENLMTTIIRTFVDHLRHRDLQGRFQFERYTAQQAFKFRRVQSLIGDLK